MSSFGTQCHYFSKKTWNAFLDFINQSGSLESNVRLMSVESISMAFPEPVWWRLRRDFLINAYQWKRINSKYCREAIVGNIPQLVMHAVAYAIDLRSSDIHLEPLKILRANSLPCGWRFASHYGIPAQHSSGRGFRIKS